MKPCFFALCLSRSGSKGHSKADLVPCPALGLGEKVRSKNSNHKSPAFATIADAMPSAGAGFGFSALITA